MIINVLSTTQSIQKSTNKIKMTSELLFSTQFHLALKYFLSRSTITLATMQHPTNHAKTLHNRQLLCALTEMFLLFVGALDAGNNGASPHINSVRRLESE